MISRIPQLVTVLAFCTAALASLVAMAGLRQDLSNWQGDRPPIGACMLAWDECRILAEKGNPHAQYMIGYAYSMGLRPEPGRTDNAVTWLERAAHQQMPSAMLMLGRMHREGEEFAADPVSAAMWFELAAKLSRDDQVRSSALYELSQLKWNLSDDQVRRIESRTRIWLNQYSADAKPPLPAFRPTDRRR